MSSTFLLQLKYLRQLFLLICFFFLLKIQQRFLATIEKTKDISEYTNGFLQKLLEELKKLEYYAVQADEIQMKSIADFQKAFEVIFMHIYICRQTLC